MAGARIPRRVWLAAIPVLVVAVAAGLALWVAARHYYVAYSNLIDKKLEAGLFAQTSNIYAAPRLLRTGERIAAGEVVSYLRRCGYEESPAANKGSYRLDRNSLEIFPGPSSYLYDGPAVHSGARVRFAGNRIAGIVELPGGDRLETLPLEPLLIINVSEQSREKRRLVRFAEIPRVLVNAVISAEDKRFFQHGGFDSLRLLKAAYVDLKEGRKGQGASTITMQLARSLWLAPDKRWSRKAAEMFITMHLEQKLSKEKIFEYYANEVYLGQRGTFSIHGFGEAARDYFGKDIRQLTLPEAATLAGLIQRPGYFDPYRYPARVLERRNLVLALMRQNGFISRAEYVEAVKSPLAVVPAGARQVEAPYFVDLVNSELQSRFPAGPVRNVYTTLDLDLQHAAEAAVQAGMERVDAEMRKQHLVDKNSPLPQVALVALDPSTGEVRAMAGGRDYRASQLDRVLAVRQPGSVFKPFVYAAAFNTALQHNANVFTPASILDDTPVMFWDEGRVYQPANFKQAVYGAVTLRKALAKSINVVTVKLASMVGFANVAELARAAGLNDVKPTPAMALGSYDARPLDIAGAYTVFANNGVYTKPELISEVRTPGGKINYTAAPQSQPVLDPRVAYLVENLLEGVVQDGTGAGVRKQGLTARVAGKTGTSRDGWFAGFTSDLVCVVWVGYDDGHDLGLEGARSALPVWTEFMKRALALPRYAKPQPFQAPAGIASAEIDPLSGQLANPECPSAQWEDFIEGTEPTGHCRLHGPPQTLAVAAADQTTTAPAPVSEPTSQ